MSELLACEKKWVLVLANLLSLLLEGMILNQATQIRFQLWQQCSSLS